MYVKKKNTRTSKSKRIKSIIQLPIQTTNQMIKDIKQEFSGSFEIINNEVEQDFSGSNGTGNKHLQPNKQTNKQRN